MLGLDNGTSLALIIDSNDFAANVELLPSTGWWERFEECDLSLTVYCTARVELGYSGDRGGFLSRVEVGDFLIREFKCYGMLAEFVLAN